jgi:hypothetical protein
MDSMDLTDYTRRSQISVSSAFIRSIRFPRPPLVLSPKPPSIIRTKHKKLHPNFTISLRHNARLNPITNMAERMAFGEDYANIIKPPK